MLQAQPHHCLRSLQVLATLAPEARGSGLADSAGHGGPAAAIGPVTLGAFRSVRRESDDFAECLVAMRKVLLETADGRTASTATIGQ